MRAGGTVLLSVNLPALNGLNLDDLVRDALGQKPSHLEVATDAVANAYDIYAINNLRGRLVSLALGTGVGAAVIDDGGVPLKVDGESPGHIGQVDCSIEGEPVIGPDGGAGSLEGYIGVPALIKKYGPDMAATLAKARPRRRRIEGPRPRDPHLPRDLLPPPRRPHRRPGQSHGPSAAGHSHARREQTSRSIAKEGWTLLSGNDDFHAAKGEAKLALKRN